jgi:hypothetical protein
MTHAFLLFYRLFPATRAPCAAQGNYPIRSSVRAPKFSMTLVDSFEVLMGSDKDFLPLVIEIGALHYVFEI